MAGSLDGGLLGGAVGVELAVGEADGVGLTDVCVAVGLGDGEWLRVGRTWLNGVAEAVRAWCRGFAVVMCVVAECVSCDAGAPASPTPTRPVSAPAAALVVASTAVARP